MKKVRILSIFVLIVSKTNSQSQFSCNTEVDNIVTPSTFGASYFCPVKIEIFPDVGNVIHNINDLDLDYISPKIHIKPQSLKVLHIKPEANSISKRSHLYAINRELDAQIIFPTDIDHVKIFERVEIGINIPCFEDRILTFLHDVDCMYKPGTNDYESAFLNEEIINPYDPSQISVDAVFVKEGQSEGGIIRNGFYYEQHVKTTNPFDWVLSSVEIRNWRIRFSPDDYGVWNCYINIWIGNKLFEQQNILSFNVDPQSVEDDPGFVRVSTANSHFLEYEKSGKNFFPIGGNYGWTRTWENNNCTTNNCYNQYDHRIVPKAIDELKNYVAQFTSAGLGSKSANLTRLWMCPWGFDIEWEKLGNYNTRQIEMGEVDDYLNYLEEKDVYLMLCQSEKGWWHRAETEILDYYDTWSGNPYNNNNLISGRNCVRIDNVNNIYDFLTNPVAKKFYKNRLRYIEARWGYSPHFLIHELFNEFVQIWGVKKFGNTSNNIIVNWSEEMAKYLKEVLHSRQLVTSTYGNFDYPAGSNSSITDQMWKQKNIDIISGHKYLAREIYAKDNFRDVDNLLKKMENQIIPIKPIILGEMGTATNTQAQLTEYCTDIVDHNLMWSSSFMGMAGSGLMWFWYRYNPHRILTPNDPYAPSSTFSWNSPIIDNSYANEYEKNYPCLRSFIESIDNISNYHPKRMEWEIINNHKFESYYLINYDNSKLYGWFHNRSFNYFDVKDCFNVNPFEPLLSNTMPEILCQDIEGKWYLAQAPHYYKFNNPPISTSCPTPLSGVPYNCEATNTDCFWNDNYYVCSFRTQTYEPANKFEFIPQKTAPLLFKGLQPGHYHIYFYWTWGADCGGEWEGNHNSNDIIVYNDSILEVNGPPTGFINDILYPGDWSYKIEWFDYLREEKNSPLKSEDKFPIKLNFDILPNPSNGIVYLKMSFKDLNCNIQIINSLGVQVYRSYGKFNENYTIDLSHLPKGHYSVKLSCDNDLIIKPLILN